MQILSKIIKIEFNGPVTLNLIENLFREKSIKPFRWAILKAENNVLTIAYSGLTP